MNTAIIPSPRKFHPPTIAHIWRMLFVQVITVAPRNEQKDTYTHTSNGTSIPLTECD